MLRGSLARWSLAAVFLLGATGASLPARDAPLGGPRRWSAGMPAGEYGVIDLQTGRVLTALPVVGWGGRGPGISFTLYHNMTSNWSLPDGSALTPLGDANGNDTVDTSDIVPFVDVMLAESPTAEQLAACDFDETEAVDIDDAVLLLDKLDRGNACTPFWTHSYSSYLLVLNGSIKVVADDATEDLYTMAGVGRWVGPAGVFAEITYGTDPVGYTLTTKSQWQAFYEQDPLNAQRQRLKWIADPSGNQVTCTYIDDAQSPADGKLDFVTDSSGRTLTLRYNLQGRLKWIDDPISRRWRLLYHDPLNPSVPTEEGTGFFVALADPMGYRIRWEYGACAEIWTISNKNGSAADPRYYYEFSYTNGRLTQIRDPAPLHNQVQEFAYGLGSLGEVHTTYTDRRAEDWEYVFSTGANNLTQVTDPLGHTEQYEYWDARPALVHECTGYVNALGKTWIATYNWSGNVLTAQDPLGHVTTFTYDALNNLMNVTPPLDNLGNGNPAKTVTYFYPNPGQPHPTSVIGISAPGGTEAEVAMEYYTYLEDPPNEPSPWWGKLRQVTDANGVETRYEYDQWGQFHSETENPDAGDRMTISPTVAQGTQFDIVGRLTSAWHRLFRRSDCGCSPAPCPGGVLCTVMGWITSVSCPCHCHVMCPVDPPNIMDPGAPRGGCLNSVLYTPMGQPTHIDRCSGDEGGPGIGSRISDLEYDVMGRTTLESVWSEEATWYGSGTPTALTRSFMHDFDDVAGTQFSTGPDSQSVFTETDAAGRVWRVTRSLSGGEQLQATYTYDAADRPTLIENSNGTRTIMAYDDANRLTGIRHEYIGHAILQMEYTYTVDGLIETIVEADQMSVPGTTLMADLMFEYDNRGRLRRETRHDAGGPGVPPVEYDLWYTYDDGGNRLTKILKNPGSGATLETTYYDYDITDPNDGDQHNNRLLHSARYAPDAQGTLLEDRWYLYGPNGELVRLIVDLPQGEDSVYWFYYDRSVHLWVSASARGDYHYDEVAQEWMFTGPWNEQEQKYDPVARVAAAEYRQDGGRQRYMVRPLDVNTMEPLPGAQWRDYLGEDIHDDYTVDQETGVVSLGTEYLAGVGFRDPADGEARYVHDDQIGSLRALSSNAVQPAIIGRKVYTAFGEAITETGVVGSRYGYAGGGGYEAADSFDPMEELGWLHVGHRYYDPSSGRFVQRDPIGIQGGLNVYLYVVNSPLSLTDPSGLYFGWALGDEETGNFLLDITGGRRSWLDDKPLVDKIAKTSMYVGFGCAAGAFGLMAAGVDVSFAVFSHGGFGATLVRAGTQTAIRSRFPTAFHINPFKWRGVIRWRPHYHRGLSKSAWRKHRPWELW